MRTPPRTPLSPPVNGGRSKFDRHYGTRRAKKLRDAFFILFALSLLAVGVVGLDPLFSQARLKLGPFLATGFLSIIFLAFALNFHLRYRSRE